MRVRETDLHVEDHGLGQPLLFAHGLLFSGRMYRAQVDALKGRYRCITYDLRGQGRSAVPRERTITIETLYEDAVALIETMGIAPCHFVGLSMGGFVGMRLAARRPELLRSLILIETAADAEPPANVAKYRVLNAITRLGGLRFLSARVLPIMFGEAFLTDPQRQAVRDEQTQQLVSNRRRIYRAVNGVIKRKGIEDELAAIRTPTLVMHGEGDRAITMKRAERMHAAIPGAKMVRIPRAGHSSTIEEPELVNAEIARFLDGLPDLDSKDEHRKPAKQDDATT